MLLHIIRNQIYPVNTQTDRRFTSTVSRKGISSEKVSLTVPYVCNYLIIEYEHPKIAHIGLHSSRRQPAQNNNMYRVCTTMYIVHCQEHTGARFDVYSKFDCYSILVHLFFFFFFSTLAYATIHVIGPLVKLILPSLVLSDSHFMPLTPQSFSLSQFSALVISSFLPSS